MRAVMVKLANVCSTCMGCMRLQSASCLYHCKKVIRKEDMLLCRMQLKVKLAQVRSLCMGHIRLQIASCLYHFWWR